jgi:hypothetical protein
MEYRKTNNLDFMKYVFSLLLVSAIWNMLHAQRLEYEVNLGPQLTKALIREYEVGIIGGLEPQSDRLLVGYTFNGTVRTSASKIQPGLQLKSDLTKYNVYLPLEFPSDYMEEKQSRWDNIYTAYRLGVGANLRLNFNPFFIQPGFNYLLAFSEETAHQIYTASLDTTDDYDGEDYTSGSGFAGELQAGVKFGKGEFKKFGIGAGVQYLFAEQTYTFDQFLHHWVVQPLDFYLVFQFRFPGVE